MADRSNSFLSGMFIAAPLSIILELFIYFLAFLPAVFALSRIILAENVLIMGFWALFGFILFHFVLAFSSAVVFFFVPYVGPGEYSSKDKVVFYVRIKDSLSTLVYRGSKFCTSLVNFFPFPGYFYYRLLGAKIHPFVSIDYNAKIFNPSMVSIGKNSVIGAYAVISGHIVSSVDKFILGKIEIGKNVVVGGASVIWPNTKIGDNSIIGTFSVVKPGTVIPSNEVWAGVPAKKIKDRGKHTVL